MTDRLRIYRWLSRLLIPRRYAGKILLLAFVATHVPLLALVGYLVLESRRGGEQGWALVGVAVAGTLLGTALVVAGLWVLLAPVTGAVAALTAYRVQGIRPTLPTDIHDEGGQLLAAVQETLLELDTALVRLADLATHDRVTGVLTRAAGEERLAEALAHVRTDGGRLALLALDADGLKGVNDRWGHAAGDCYLQQIATVVAQHVSPTGWVARWGGDEFIAVLPEVTDVLLPETLLQRITDDVATQPLCLPSGTQVPCSVSGGVAWATQDDDAGTLVARADAQLYQAKRASMTARGGVAIGDDGAEDRPAEGDCHEGTAGILPRGGGAADPPPGRHHVAQLGKIGDAGSH